MTHPNVEYFSARFQATKSNNEALKKSLLAVMSNTNDNTLFELLSKAHARLGATESLAESLLTRVGDYEEQIALLK